MVEPSAFNRIVAGSNPVILINQNLDACFLSPHSGLIRCEWLVFGYRNWASLYKPFETLTTKIENSDFKQTVCFFTDTLSAANTFFGIVLKSIEFIYPMK